MKNVIILAMALLSFSVQANEWKYLFATEKINEIKEIDGKYYAATDGGLFVIDVKNIKSKQHFTIADGLPSQRIEDIATDSSGNIWIGTYDNGVAMKQSNGWLHIPIPRLSHNNSINPLYCLEFDQFNNLWIGTHDGIFKYVNGEWERNEIGFGHQLVWDMYKDNVSGDIYMASHRPVKLEGTELIDYQIEGIFAYGDASICYDNGKIYYASDVGDFLIIENDNTTVYGPEVFSNGGVTDVEVMDNGDVWTSSFNGDIYKFAGGVWTKMLDSNENNLNIQLYKNSIGDLLICKEEEIYKSNGNLINMDEALINLVTQIPGTYINIKIDEDKKILVESDYQLFEVNSNNFELKKIEPLEGKENYVGLETVNFPDNSTGFFEKQTGNLFYNNQTTNVLDIIEYGSYRYEFFVDSEGGYWIVTNKGLVYKNGEEIILFDETNTPFSITWPQYGAPNFYKVAEDRSKNIWVTGAEGIGQWNRVSETWIFYPIDNITLAQHLNILYCDEQNVLWTSGSATGLMSFDGENWKTFTTDNSNIPSNFVEDIFPYKDMLLLATREGLAFFDGTDFKTYNTETSAISSNYCKAIEQDGNGNIWIAHTKQGLQNYGGISIFNPNGITFSENELPQIGTQNAASIILNEDQFLEFNVYPNPANKFINIDFNQYKKKVSTVQLMDAYGKINFSKNISPREQNLKIFTGDLANGIYTLHIDDGQQIKSRKIIIQ